MNAVTASYPINQAYRVPRQLNRTNVAIGIALSVLMHLAFVAWSLQHKMMLGAAKPAEQPIAIRLMPLPVPPLAPAVQAPPPPPPLEKEIEKKQAAKTAAQVKEKMPPAAINIITSDKTNKATPDDNTVAPPQTTDKHVDLGAMQANIKSALAQVDREKADTPSGQLVAKPLYPPDDETKMGKMINGTTRADCKEQVSGMGLLAPLGALATLLDKKNSGCKWR